MSAIVFRNPGLIDLRAIKTFGLHVKPMVDNPLGAFGTGAKFAVAVLLRTGHKVTLYYGLDVYTFGTKSIDSRGKEFSVATMHDATGHGEELPFTLHLGFQWKVYMGYRELHSNVLDEKGETFRHNSSLPYEPRPDETAFVVEGAGIEQAYDSRDSIFLPSKPILENDDMEIHKGGTNSVFYRGVKVNELSRPGLFTYNLKTLIAGLTEDRTMKDPCDLTYYLSRFIVQSDNEPFLKTALMATQDHLEYHLWDTVATPSSTFMRVYEGLRRDGNMTELTAFADRVYRSVKKTLPLPAPISLTKIQQQQLDRAKAFCAKAGWLDEKYPIVVIPHAHGGLLALAEDGKVILSAELFDHGCKSLVHGILEETLHLKHGFKDLTREFQTHLFRQLINAKEECLGEAL